MFINKQCHKCGNTVNAEETWIYCPVCGKPYDSKPSGSKKRRGNGQGSVTKLATGNWRASVVIEWKDSSHPIRRYKSGFKTKSEAIAYLPTLAENRPREAHSLTLRELFEEYGNIYQKSKSTWDCYKAAFKYLTPLHDRFFRDITIDEWQECVDKCPQGRRTKENIRSLLSLLYKYAIPRGWVAPELMSFRGEFIRINEPTTQPDRQGFTDDDMEKLWGHMDIPFVGVILLMCYTGFRLGEFLSVEYKNGCLIGGSKTEAGMNRVVPVSPKVEQFVPMIPYGMTPKTFREKFYAALDVCGIQNENHRLTPHSTRHTFATLIKKVTAPDKDKLRLIGHSSEEMLRYYQDVSVDDLRKITDNL